MLALTHPHAIREMHREFLDAGAEVLQVMAFYGSRDKLATVGYGEKTMEINRAATRLAREVADQVPAERVAALLATARFAATSEAVRLGYAFVAMGTSQDSIAEGQQMFASGKRVEWKLR